MTTEARIAFEKTGQEYHLVAVDETNTPVFDYGALKDRRSIDPNLVLLAQSPVFATGDEYPLDVPGCQFWLDPQDETVYEMEYAARIQAGENQNYITALDHSDADFDLSNTTGAGQTKASWEIWLGHEYLISSGTAGLDRTFFSHNRNATNSGGWTIGTGGSVGQYYNVQFFIATNSSGSTYAVVRIPYTLPFSHLCITYDGTVATAADRLLCYIDGVLIDKATYVLTGTPPVAFLNPSAITPSIGREGHSSHHDADHCFNCVRLYKNVVFDQASVTRRYNYGRFVKYDDLTSSDKTGCVGAWDLDESSSASYADSSGLGNNMVSVGTVTAQRLVESVREKAKNRVLKAINYSSVGLYTKPAYFSRPRYNTNSINNTPGLEIKYHQSLYAPASDLFGEETTTDIFQVVKYVALSGTEQFTLLSASEIDTTRYFLLGWVSNSGSNKPTLRIKDSNSSVGDNHIRALTSISAGTVYLFNWRMVGTGDAASVEFRLNGVGYSLEYGSSGAYNSSWASVPIRNNLCIGGLTRTSGPDVSDLNAHIGDTIVYAPGLTLQQNRDVERWIANRAGITLP